MNPEISKSARKLLAKQPAAESHPSADLLNAYVEQSLSAPETTQVLAHLSSCAECREVVFLASNAVQEEMQPELMVAAAKAAAARPTALASPAADQLRGCAVLEPAPKRKNVWWKWAAPLAAVIIIGATALVERRETGAMLTSSGPRMAYQRAAAPAVSAPSAPPIVQADKTEQSSPSNTISFDGPPPETKGKMSAAYAAKRNEAAQREQLFMNEKPARNLQEMNSNLENRHADLRAGATQAKAAPVTPGLQSDVAASAPNGGNDLTYLVPDAAKPQSLAKSSLMANDQAEAGTVSAMPMVRHQPGNFRWRIGKEGQLERSTGSGTWTQKMASEDVTFRAVASVGSDVWAGGNGGALFHSGDGGGHFSKVKLSADGQPERGAIVSIHFDTAQQGSVTSDSGTTWTTTDGGQSWTKQ